jgi:hypothetical protein
MTPTEIKLGSSIKSTEAVRTAFKRMRSAGRIVAAVASERVPRQSSARVAERIAAVMGERELQVDPAMSTTSTAPDSNVVYLHVPSGLDSVEMDIPLDAA